MGDAAINGTMGGEIINAQSAAFTTQPRDHNLK